MFEQQQINVDYMDVMNFIRGLSFSRVILGANQEEVYSSMRELDGLYHKKVNDVASNFDRKIQDIEGQLKIYQEKCNSSETILLGKEQEIKLLQDKLAENDNIIKKQADTLDKLAEGIKNLSEKVDSFVNNYSTNLDSEREYKQRVMDTEEQIKMWEEKNRELQKKLDDSSRENAQLQQEIDEKDVMITKLQLELDEKDKQIDILKADVDRFSENEESIVDNTVNDMKPAYSFEQKDDNSLNALILGLEQEMRKVSQSMRHIG